MKISRALTSRKHSGNSVDITGGRFLPRWVTTRRAGKNTAVAGSTRRVFRGHSHRTRGVNIP